MSKAREIANKLIDGMNDVTITSPASGQALVYNGSAWVNGNPSTAGNGGVTSVNGQTGAVSVETGVIGVGQTWQDVTASRVGGITYTNSTGKPIMILLAFYNDVTVTIGAIPAFVANNDGLSNATNNVSIIVPNGVSYKFTSTYGILRWLELR